MTIREKIRRKKIREHGKSKPTIPDYGKALPPNLDPFSEEDQLHELGRVARGERVKAVRRI